MKRKSMKEFFIGMGAAAGLIGIALVGIAFGYSLKEGVDTALSAHSLFMPGVSCIVTGSLMIFISTRIIDHDKA